MGVLKHLSSGRAVVLTVHAVAGRAPSCAVRLADEAASNDHCSVAWTGERWEARDLGSTNGTVVDDMKLRPRENARLVRGSVLRFGCDAERWALIDDGGPVVVARAVPSGEVRAAEDGLLALPDPTNVLVAIVMDSAGRWVIERPDGTRRPARDAEHIAIAGQAWVLTVPPASPVAGTYKEKPHPTLATLTLRFHVSRDEEHVRVEAVDGEHVLLLGERTSFYMLLVLARERRKHAAETDLPDREQGWIHVIDLTKALNMEESTLNVAVHRVREVFAKAGVEGAEGIVERRPREIRIGVEHWEEIKA